MNNIPAQAPKAPSLSVHTVRDSMSYTPPHPNPVQKNCLLLYLVLLSLCSSYNWTVTMPDVLQHMKIMEWEKQVCMHFIQRPHSHTHLSINTTASAKSTRSSHTVKSTSWKDSTELLQLLNVHKYLLLSYCIYKYMLFCVPSTSTVGIPPMKNKHSKPKTHPSCGWEREQGLLCEWGRRNCTKSRL